MDIQAVAEHRISVRRRWRTAFGWRAAHRTSAEAVAALPISVRRILAAVDIRAAAAFRTSRRARLRASLRMRLRISVRLTPISRGQPMVGWLRRSCPWRQCRHANVSITANLSHANLSHAHFAPSAAHSLATTAHPLAAAAHSLPAARQAAFHSDPRAFASHRQQFAAERRIPAVLESRLASLASSWLDRPGVLALCLWRLLLLRSVA